MAHLRRVQGAIDVLHGAGAFARRPQVRQRVNGEAFRRLIIGEPGSHRAGRRRAHGQAVKREVVDALAQQGDRGVARAARGAVNSQAAGVGVDPDQHIVLLPERRGQHLVDDPFADLLALLLPGL